MDLSETLRAQSPLIRAAVAFVLVAAGGWIVFALVVSFAFGWSGALVAAFMIPASGLTAAFAWPQLHRSDPARESTLVLVLFLMLFVALLASALLLYVGSTGPWMWIGPAAMVTTAVPLIMVQLDRSIVRSTVPPA